MNKRDSTDLHLYHITKELEDKIESCETIYIKVKWNNEGFCHAEELEIDTEFEVKTMTALGTYYYCHNCKALFMQNMENTFCTKCAGQTVLEPVKIFKRK